MALPGFIRHILGPQRFPQLRGQDVPISEGDKTPLQVASEEKLKLLKPDFVPTVPINPPKVRKSRNGIR